MEQVKINKNFRNAVVKDHSDANTLILTSINSQGNLEFQWAATEGKTLEEIKIFMLTHWE